MYYLESSIAFEIAYKELLQKILTQGRIRNVRSFETKELSPFVLTTTYPMRNILTNKTRAANRAFMSAEFLWILSGRNDVEMISTYNSKIGGFSDNMSSFRGAYGPLVQRQLDYIINCFSKDLRTRQAVISIWQPNPSASKDIPCTLSLQFLHDETINALDLVVTMRSNDAWLGLPYDFYNFTMIQNYLAMKLQMRLGRYTHQAASEHLYAEHFEKAKLACVGDTIIADINESSVFENDQLAETMKIENEMRAWFRSGILADYPFTNRTQDLHESWKELLEPMYLYLQKKDENSCLQA